MLPLDLTLGSPQPPTPVNLVVVLYHHDDDDDDDDDAVAIMQLGHLLTCSCFMHPEVSSVVFPGSFFLFMWSFYCPGYSVTRHSLYMLYPISLAVLCFARTGAVFNSFAIYGFVCNLSKCILEACGSAVVWGTALQTRRFWVQFLMMSLEIFIDIILPAALWPWYWISL